MKRQTVFMGLRILKRFIVVQQETPKVRLQKLDYIRINRFINNGFVSISKLMETGEHGGPTNHVP